jgi:hypothetical protein
MYRWLRGMVRYRCRRRRQDALALYQRRHSATRESRAEIISAVSVSREGANINSRNTYGIFKQAQVANRVPGLESRQHSTGTRILSPGPGDVPGKALRTWTKGRGLIPSLVTLQ